MSNLPKVIQGLILFSTLLGIFFLWQVYPVLPAAVFDFVAFGWVLFVLDSFLTFVRPKASFYLGVVLAALALVATLSQPEHYTLVSSGNIPATITIFLGSAAEILLIGTIAYYFAAGKKGDPWAWPSAKSGP
jgi:hypothetical protein